VKWTRAEEAIRRPFLNLAGFSTRGIYFYFEENRSLADRAPLEMTEY